MRIAFISGTSIVNTDIFSSWDRHTITTPYGMVHYRQRGTHIVINRHGPDAPLPPHAINHRANIRAIADLGFTDVVSLNSVGSLRLDLPPGSIISCADYVCLQQGPQTFFYNEMKGGSAGIDNNLIPLIVERLSSEFTVQTGMVYVQMQGPRFETKAEVQIIKNWGDVAGMTAAHEADLCREIGLHYNSLAIVDNFATGLDGGNVDFARFMDLVYENQTKVNNLLARLLDILD